MKLLIFTLERNLELEKEHKIKYLDHNIIHALGEDEVRREILEFAPDLVIEREFNDSRIRYDGLMEWMRQSTNFRTAVWLIDTHCMYSRHKKYSGNFHYVFVAISKYLEKFRKWNPNTFWLPLCFPYDSTTINVCDSPKLYDISFVGNYKQRQHKRRKKMLDAIRREFGDRLMIKTDYLNMNQLIGSSRVSFNCSLDGDLNYRIWEVLANGVELVTDYVPDIYKIHGLAGRIHLYDEKKEMLERLHAVLEGRSQKDTADNREWVRREHCVSHRYRSMLRMIDTAVQEVF